jgi:hypothetical protein
MALITVVFIMIISFSTRGVVIAQTTGGDTTPGNVGVPPQNPQPPQQVDPIPPDNLQPPEGIGTPSDFPGSEDFPQPVIQPQKELNPYELSTLGGTTGFGGRTEESTLGTSTNRRSNLEVNKPRERKNTEEEAEAVTQEAVTGAETSTEQSASEESAEFTPSSPLGKGGALYKWVDKNGVVHVTNDFGSIPPEYRQRVLEGSQGDEDIQP